MRSSFVGNKLVILGCLATLVKYQKNDGINPLLGGGNCRRWRHRESERMAGTQLEIVCPSIRFPTSSGNPWGRWWWRCPASWRGPDDRLGQRTLRSGLGGQRTFLDGMSTGRWTGRAARPWKRLGRELIPSCFDQFVMQRFLIPAFKDLTGDIGHIASLIVFPLEIFNVLQ